MPRRGYTAFKPRVQPWSTTLVSARPICDTGSDDPIFQPAQFSAENSLREPFAAQIYIVSNAAKHPINA